MRTTKSRPGSDAVETVVETLTEIQSRASESGSGIVEISDALESQAQNTAEVTSAVEETAALSQEMAASLQQISASLEEQTTSMESIAETTEGVAATSEDVHEIIDQFRLKKDESTALDDVLEDLA
jgi:methyl-accepting chemotaxis protein